MPHTSTSTSLYEAPHCTIPTGIQVLGGEKILKLYPDVSQVVGNKTRRFRGVFISLSIHSSKKIIEIKKEEKRKKKEKKRLGKSSPTKKNPDRRDVWGM